MAGVTLTLKLEGDLIQDAVADLARVHVALAKRHGEAFRTLERRIDRIVEGEVALSPPRLHMLPENVVLAEPSPEIVAILADARRLGVI